MSGIARILLARGLTVSGCDAKESTVLAPLRALGATVDIGHDPAHLEAIDTLIVSSAIRATNPELVAAQASGRRVLPRAAALASVMAGRIGLAVAGTHGKTTTTSMLTVAMHACGRDPSYAIGGDLNEPGSNAHHGTGEFFVAEADESDRSFLLLSPHGAVITNVEPDHLDNYGNAAAVARSVRGVRRPDRPGRRRPARCRRRRGPAGWCRWPATGACGCGPSADADERRRAGRCRSSWPGVVPRST